MLLKMGKRIRDNWQKYGQEEQVSEEIFFKLDNLKRMFLSQKFITVFLRSLTMFEDWTFKSLEKLLYVAEMKTWSKKEHIFSQEEEANGFYIVFKGDVLVTYKLHKSYKEKLAFDKNILKSKNNSSELENSIN